MDKKREIKIIVSMIGLDEHRVGGEVVASILRNAGMEVVYLGTYQTPEMIVQAAIEEDVDAIGLSLHASNYSQVAEMMDLLRKKEISNIIVVCGGTIPRQQIPILKKNGVAEVFTPESTPDSIVDYIVSNVRAATGEQSK